jgi:hypothetical protein
MVHMQTFALIVIGCYLAPWLPFFFLEKLSMQRVFEIASGAASSSGVLSEAYSSSIYRASVLNEHSVWNALLGDRRKYLEATRLPHVAVIFWVFVTNVAVILVSRTNKQLSSHKKSTLQLLLCLQVNFLVGAPKMQCYEGVLTTICLLQLLLYSDFSSLGLVFAIAPAGTWLPLYSSAQLPAYFLTYALQFYVAAPLLRNMLFACIAQQGKSTKTMAAEDPESKAQSGKHKKIINEAFRAQYSLVRMLAQRNKWGLSKVLIGVQDYVFYFYCLDFPIFSLLWLNDIVKPQLESVMRTQIAIKLLITSIMTVETLLSHLYGPTRSQEKIEQGEALSKGAFRSPLSEDRRQTVETVGLDEKTKQI